MISLHKMGKRDEHFGSAQKAASQLQKTFVAFIWLSLYLPHFLSQLFLSVPLQKRTFTKKETVSECDRTIKHIGKSFLQDTQKAWQKEKADKRRRNYRLHCTTAWANFWNVIVIALQKSSMDYFLAGLHLHECAIYIICAHEVNRSNASSGAMKRSKIKDAEHIILTPSRTVVFQQADLFKVTAKAGLSRAAWSDKEWK